MYNRIYQFSDHCIDGLYEAIKWYCAIGVCLMFLVEGTTSKGMLIASAGLLVFLKIYKTRLYELNKFINYTLFTLISIVLAYLFYRTSLASLIFGGLYAFFIQYYMIYNRSNSLYYDDEIKQAGFVVLLCGVLTFFSRNDAYSSSINTIGVFYTFFALFYLIRLNLITEYNTATISIAKNKNILIINITLITLAFTFIVLGKNALTLLPNLVISLLYLFFKALQLLWVFSLWIVYKFQAIYLFLTNYAQGGYQEKEYIEKETLIWVEPEYFDWNLIEMLPEGAENPYLIPTILVLIFVLFALVLGIAFIITFYQKKKHVYNHVEVQSEKSFIYERTSFIQQIKERFRKYFSTTSNNEIRKAYTKAVNEHYKKGVILEPYMTPNEYARIARAEGLDENDSFSTLTSKYNEVRYRE